MIKKETVPLTSNEKEVLNILQEPDITCQYTKALFQVNTYPSLFKLSWDKLREIAEKELMSYNLIRPDQNGRIDPHYLLDHKTSKIAFHLAGMAKREDITFNDLNFSLKREEYAIPILLFTCNAEENILSRVHKNKFTVLLKSYPEIIMQYSAMIFEAHNFLMPLTWADLPKELNEYFLRALDIKEENGSIQVPTSTRFLTKSFELSPRERLIKEVAFRVFMIDESLLAEYNSHLVNKKPRLKAKVGKQLIEKMNRIDLKVKEELAKITKTIIEEESKRLFP